MKLMALHTRMCLATFLMATTVFAENRVISLYEGKPPGSESWTQTEAENTKNLWRTRLIYNVVEPTMTVFPAAEPNGTAMIICPGGGFHCLSIDSEGNQVADWLTEKGVTCFVLRYRLVECKTDNPALELLQKRNWPEEEIEAIVRMATADGLEAIKYVRTNAESLGVDPDKIGMIGFSAGGTLAVSVAYECDDESRPNFLASIYAQYDWALKTPQVPEAAPPIFILAATNDQLGLAAHSVRIYEDWTQAKKSAELHLYAKGGHGFGMRKQNLPSDEWPQPFYTWLVAQGYVPEGALPVTSSDKAATGN